MNTEKLKPFNEFNSEKSAMVNEICYRLSKESNNFQIPIKELKKIQIPKQLASNEQIAVTIGPGAEYRNTGFIPILFETGPNVLAFGKYTDSSGAKLVIKNKSTTTVSTRGVLYLLVTGVL